MVVAQNAPAPTPRIEMVLLNENNQEAKLGPTDMLNGFFDAVKAGKIEEALSSLTKNSPLANKPEDVETLKNGMQKALDKYGDVDGFEILEKKAVGNNLLRVTCISLGEDMPLRWRFFFYKNKGVWRLLDMRVDSGIADLFEEIGRSNK